MQPIGNWGQVTATNGGRGLLPEGGYVCKIDRVADHTDEKKPYLSIIFNPYVDGDFYFGSDAQDWQHEAKFYLTTDFGLGRYKMLVECAENSEGNNAFSYNADVPNHEQQLVGKWVGLVIRHRLYTKKQGKNAGKDGSQLDVQFICTTQAITAGQFPDPVTKDDRDANAAPVANSDLAEYDLPF